jgi:photosystem II stability/assembly factor-like uncharacterized protein
VTGLGDVDGEQKIGLPEALYVLQHLTGPRQNKKRGRIGEGNCKEESMNIFAISFGRKTTSSFLPACKRRLSAVIKALLLFLTAFAVSFLFAGVVLSAPVWTCGGPYGGDVICLAMAETDSDILYAGTTTAVFKSVDGGTTWSRTAFPDIAEDKDTRIREAGVTVIRISLDDPSVVYAGTEEKGLYKSSDGGDSWVQKGLAGNAINDIAVDSTNSNVLYVGIGHRFYLQPGRVYKSTDGGETWQIALEVEEYASGNRVLSILIDSNDSQVVYAGVDGWDKQVYKSTDRGATWTGKDVGSGTGQDVDELVMTPAEFSPAAIYARSGESKIYKSTDQGETWQHIGADLSFPIVDLTISPVDPAIIYVSHYEPEAEFYKTTDGGETWSRQTTSGLPPGPLSDMAISPAGDIVAGCAEGVFMSKDGAGTWRFSSQGMINTFIEDIAVVPGSPDTVYTTVQGDYTLSKSIDGGATWHYFDSGPFDLSAVVCDPLNPQTVWTGDGYQGGSDYFVYKSADEGITWAAINCVHLTSSGVNKTTAIRIKEDDSDAILVGGQKDPGFLVRSTDCGQSWDGIIARVFALALDPNDSNIAYWGSQDRGQVFRHSNIWKESMYSFDIIASDFGDVRDIEVDSNSTVFVAAEDGLWKWVDPDWEKMPGLPSDDITALAIDRTTTPDTLYAGTKDQGVFCSKFHQDHWMALGFSIPAPSIHRLALGFGQQKMLYAGTTSRGVWRRTVASMGDVDGNGDIELGDAVLALKLLSSMPSKTSFDICADADGDGNIGLAEAVFVLQHLAGRR